MTRTLDKTWFRQQASLTILNFLLVCDYNRKLSQTKFDSKANANQITKEILEWKA